MGPPRSAAREATAAWQTSPGWDFYSCPFPHPQLLSLNPRAEKPTGLRPFLTPISMHFKFTL